MGLQTDETWSLATKLALRRCPCHPELDGDRISPTKTQGDRSMALYLGLVLMALGIVLFFIGRQKSRTVRVVASGGSIAVGGKNTGSITNLNVGTPPPAAHGTHLLTYAAVGVELVGIAVTLWHAWHMAAK